MVAPVVAAAGIGAIGNFIGGIFGRNNERKAIREQNAYNDPAAVRARFEAAGFNPLLGIQPGVGMQQAVGGTNYIGAAIADSFMSVADAYSTNAQQKAEKQAVEAENEKLRRQVQVETIRPRVAGLYGRPQGETISMRNTPNGWVSEYDADFVGKKVMAGPFGADNDAYYGRNPERTVLRLPFGDVSPADVSDAEDGEKRYGDLVSWAQGLANLSMDAGRTLRVYTDSKGWTNPTENLVTESLPRVMGEGVNSWRKWSQDDRKKKGGTGNDGFGIKSGAYEGWMDSTFGKGHIN